MIFFIIKYCKGDYVRGNNLVKLDNKPKEKV
jgi:hypothetical protein